MPSKNSARIGRIAEEAAQRKYAARSNHSSWHDIEYRNGTKADVKAAVHKRNGRYGRFRLWEEAHQKLLESGGGYVFAVHSSDTGKVLKMVRMSAREVEQRLGGIDWYHAGHEGKDSRQVKISWPKLL